MNESEYDIEQKRSTGFSFASSSPIVYPVEEDVHQELRALWRKAQFCIWASDLTPTYEIEALHKFDMIKWLGMY